MPIYRNIMFRANTEEKMMRNVTQQTDKFTRVRNVIKMSNIRSVRSVRRRIFRKELKYTDATPEKITKSSASTEREERRKRFGDPACLKYSSLFGSVLSSHSHLIQRVGQSRKKYHPLEKSCGQGKGSQQK